jgi:hypothetical protein
MCLPLLRKPDITNSKQRLVLVYNTPVSINKSHFDRQDSPIFKYSPPFARSVSHLKRLKTTLKNPKMQFYQCIFGLLALSSLGLTVPLADSSSLVERAPASDTIHCGSKGVLSQSDASVAFDNAVDDSQSGSCGTFSNSQYISIGGQRAAIYKSGDVQFYICNNAKSTRCFNVNSAELSTLNSAFKACKYNDFWIESTDKWSAGFDISGTSECGF